MNETNDMEPPLVGIVGECPAMRQVRHAIALVCRVDVPVLLVGEAGTGKDLVAAAIHRAGPRAGMPLVKFCAAGASEATIEAELFGREKGALPDSPAKRVGLIEAARGGTLMLEEPGQFTPALQVRLLRAVQDRQFERVGSSKVRASDARFIVATRCDLAPAVAAGAFREDLYYLLSVLPILLPPLRDRREDVLPLAEHFARAASARWDRPFRRVSTAAVDLLMAHPWPGNVRELANCIERALLDTHDGVIHPQHLPGLLHRGPVGAPSPGSMEFRVAALERGMLADALGRSGGNVRAAARELGITPRMARYKIAKLRIDPSLFKHRQQV